MWYMGGKFRQSKQIAATIKDIVGESDFNYYEPFCGAMWSATRVIKECSPSKVVLSDISEALITMWKHLVNTDDVPPHLVTEEVRNEYKEKQDPKDWLTAWYGFATSFGGKWFGTIARHTRERKPIYDFSPGVKSTVRKVNVLKLVNNLSINNCEYQEYRHVRGAVFYLDPPYKDRTKCHDYKAKFDHEKFWNFVRHLSKNNVVLVTEFITPDDFLVLHDWGDTVVRHYAAKNYGDASEKLVTWVDGKFEL